MRAAYRAGSVPELTPAFAAVELSIMRTFGRWQVQPIDSNSALDVGRSSILIEALAARLTLRKVEVHLGCEIESIKIHGVLRAPPEVKRVLADRVQTGGRLSSR